MELKDTKFPEMEGNHYYDHMKEICELANEVHKPINVLVSMLDEKTGIPENVDEQRHKFYDFMDGHAYKDGEFIGYVYNGGLHDTPKPKRKKKHEVKVDEE